MTIIKIFGKYKIKFKNTFTYKISILNFRTVQLKYYKLNNIFNLKNN